MFYSCIKCIKIVRHHFMILQGIKASNPLYCKLLAQHSRNNSPVKKGGKADFKTNIPSAFLH